MTKKDTTRYGSIDYIKAIAIVAVIITHAGLRGTDPNLTAFEKVLRQSWVVFQVPSFFIVAGFLYYRDDEIKLSDVGHRVLRILIPYLVASSVVMMLGFTRVDQLSNILYDLLTGNALGIYYFIFALAYCIPFIWIFSRVGTPALFMLLIALLSYSAGMAFSYLPRPTYGMFWSVREPFFTFFLGYFLIGWLVARHIRKLQPLLARTEKYLWVPLLLGAAAYVTAKAQAMLNHQTLGPRNALYAIAYTLSATSLITIFTHTLRVPVIVRFLSEASLTIYLYHRLFQFELLPHTSTWSPILRILAMLLAGLLGSSLVAVVGKRLLGRRSKILLGF